MPTVSSCHHRRRIGSTEMYLHRNLIARVSSSPFCAAFFRDESSSSFVVVVAVSGRCLRVLKGEGDAMYPHYIFIYIRR